MPRIAQAPAKTQKSPATKTAANPAKKTPGQAVHKPTEAPLKVTPAKKMPSPLPKIASQANAVAHKTALAGVVGGASDPSTPDLDKTVKGKTKAKSAAKEVKPPKHKLVRDSFTFPQSEYLTLVEMKKRLLAAGIDAKKGELVRAGISMLASLDDKALVKALAAVEKLKAGRPTK